jgi:hypothetical protein
VKIFLCPDQVGGAASTLSKSREKPLSRPVQRIGCIVSHDLD